MQEIRNSLKPCRSTVSNPAVGLWTFQKSSASTDCLASCEFREEMDIFVCLFLKAGDERQSCSHHKAFPNLAAPASNRKSFQ